MDRVAPVAIALGSNLGDRRVHILWAMDQLALELDDFRASTIIETVAVDVPDEQPRYLNAVITGRTSRAPDDLLARLMELERTMGRTRPSMRAARTLDLDVILYGDRVIDREGLVIPHPRFRERRFVLEPLAEIAGEWVDPVSGETVNDLLSKLR